MTAPIASLAERRILAGYVRAALDEQGLARARAASMRCDLYALERKGLIERDKRKARALRIVALKANAPIPLSLDSEGTGAPEV